MACGVLGALFHKMVWEFDLWTRWAWLDYTPEGARSIVSAITSSMLTFIVFFLSMLIIAVQLAAAQLTPRIIARVFERRVSKVAGIGDYEGIGGSRLGHAGGPGEKK